MIYAPIENDLSGPRDKPCLKSNVSAAICKYHQVLGSVIFLHFIDVMHLFRSLEVSAKQRFGNQPMLENITARNSGWMTRGQLVKITRRLIDNAALPVVALVSRIRLPSLSPGFFGLFQAKMGNPKPFTSFGRTFNPKQGTVLSSIFSSSRRAHFGFRLFGVMAAPHRMIFLIPQSLAHGFTLALAAFGRIWASTNRGGTHFLDSFWGTLHSFKHLIDLCLHSTLNSYQMQP
jgi:hypothetical protein